MKLSGIFTAAVTPFDAKGDIDQEGLRQNLRFQLKHHVDGVVVLGTTGEGPTLTHEEKRLVIKIAVEELKGKCTLFVGTGTYATAAAVAATQEAKELGADGALIIAPYYNRPTQEGLFQHFSTICQRVPLPIVIYNHPLRTGQSIHPETLERLILNFPSIVGFKDCSNNISYIHDVIECAKGVRPDFNIFSGDDILAFPLMAMGGQGVISTISNLIPRPMRALVDAVIAENYPLAREWHYRLSPLFKASSVETNPIPIKALMHFCHMAAGLCRLPLCALSDENSQQLARITKTLPAQWIS
jgi:4-hydroxy-tetrahydrodipicolinate synthase